jgi:hypothetical protein
MEDKIIPENRYNEPVCRPPRATSAVTDRRYNSK